MLHSIKKICVICHYGIQLTSSNGIRMKSICNSDSPKPELLTANCCLVALAVTYTVH